MPLIKYEISLYLTWSEEIKASDFATLNAEDDNLEIMEIKENNDYKTENLKDWEYFTIPYELIATDLSSQK